MNEYQLPFGQGIISAQFPPDYQVDWIEPDFVSPASNPVEVIRQAIRNPVDGRRIRDCLQPQTGSIAIAINDKTRPVPNQYILPPLLEELHANGFSTTAIKFIIATGTHIPIRSDEFSRILSEEIFNNYEVISHNCDDLENLTHCGTTTRGTPVWVNRIFHEADLKIVVGNIEPHHFAGFSGGYKTAAIGLAGRQTINTNHSMLVEPGAKIAEYENNPLRQDIEEIGKSIGVDLALNVVLNGEKKIVQAVFGNPGSVMQTGIPISREICQIQAVKRYDMVVASAGGAPKDINFYQSQKALTHASLFTRDGGVIVLVAACPEGTGSDAYVEFMKGLKTPDEVFMKFRTHGFKVGPHKALQVARDAERVKIVLLSMLPPGLVNDLLMTPAESISDAIAKAYNFLRPTPAKDLHIAVLPRATNTIPKI